MKTKFIDQLRVKLKVYSEMTGKSKLESVYDALSIAISVKRKSIDLKKLFVPIATESKYLIESRLRAEKKRSYSRAYYQKNAEKLKARKRELRLIKKMEAA